MLGVCVGGGGGGGWGGAGGEGGEILFSIFFVFQDYTEIGRWVADIIFICCKPSVFGG